MSFLVGLTFDVKQRGAFSASPERSGALLAANELLAASGDLQAV